MQGETEKTISNTNLRNFKLNELKSLLTDDIRILNILKDSYPLTTNFTAKEMKIISSEYLTIGDHSEIEIHKGSENLYFNFLCYLINEDFEIYHAIKISIFTKDNHKELKEIIKVFINQI